MNSITVTLTVTYSKDELDQNLNRIFDPEPTTDVYVEMALELADDAFQGRPRKKFGVTTEVVVK